MASLTGEVIRVMLKVMPFLLAILAALFVATAVLAEDAGKAEKSAEPKKPVRYEPLIVPEGAEHSGSTVPKPAKTPAPDPWTGKIADSPDAGGSVAATSPLRAPGIPAGDKKNKEQLWIYTLPQEQEALRQQAEARELRAEEWEQYQRARQLPEWAIDPEFRKYFASPSPGDPAAQPGLPSAFRQDGWFSGSRSIWGDPGAAGSEEPGGKLWDGGTGAGPVDNRLSSRGTLLNEPGATAGKTEAPAGLWREKDSDGKAEQGAAPSSLFQSNKKEKRVEDFYKGVNKAVEVEEADDRYHKPTKPQ